MIDNNNNDNNNNTHTHSLTDLVMSSPAEVVQAKKTTSTLLDGNHVFPPFYACYLLRSRATEKSQRTYVSTCM